MSISAFALAKLAEVLEDHKIREKDFYASSFKQIRSFISLLLINRLPNGGFLFIRM